jgi:hypothetical protein
LEEETGVKTKKRIQVSEFAYCKFVNRNKY